MCVIAIYHFSAQVIGRSSGRCATAAAAYRAHERIEDERTGLIHDYTRRHGDFETFILAPKNAPDWVYDRAALWNAVEAAERRSNAQVAREINLALPIELTRAEQKALLHDFVQQIFVNDGKITDIAMHFDHQENPHAHIMLTMREIGPEGFGKKMAAPTKTRSEWALAERAQLAWWREEWANFANYELRKRGFAEIDERSLQKQGMDRLPQIHEGPHARAMEKKGILTERGDWNRAAKEHAWIDQEEKAVVVSLAEYREEREALLQEADITTELPWREHLCACIDEALANTSSFFEFQSFLQDTYEIQMKIQNVNVSFLYPGNERYIRAKQLGDKYTKEALQVHLSNNEIATAQNEVNHVSNQQPKINSGQSAIIGTLLAHGFAPYEYEQKNKSSYFVTIATNRGEKTLWGVDLQRAIKESDVELTDQIQLQYQGSQPITIQVPLYDQEGRVIGEQSRETKRNTWHIERAQEQSLRSHHIGEQSTYEASKQTNPATIPHRPMIENPNTYGNKPAIIGTLLAHGSAPYEQNPKNKSSYFVTIETKRGEKTLWGVDLARALDKSHIEIGDRIQLQYLGSQPVTVQVPFYDKEGHVIGEKSIDTQRNAWQIDHAPVWKRNDQYRSNRAKKTQSNDLVRFDKLLDLYRKVDQLQQEKEQNLQEIRLWKSQGWNVKRQTHDVFEQLQKQTERLTKQITRITSILPWDNQSRIWLEEARQHASSLQDIQSFLQETHSINLDLTSVQTDRGQDVRNQQREPYAVIGTLLSHGSAPYERDSKNKLSYFITIATSYGEKTLWGVDLQRAIKESDVTIGDRIRVDNQGYQQVIVQTNVHDDHGNVIGDKTIQTNRNVWIIRKALPDERITRTPEQLRETRRKADEKWKNLHNDIVLMEKYLELYSKLDTLKGKKEQNLLEIRAWHNQSWIARARSKEQLATMEQEVVQLDKQITRITWQLPPEDREALIAHKEQTQQQLDVVSAGIRAIDRLLQNKDMDKDRPVQHIKKKGKKNQQQNQTRQNR